MRRCAMRTHLRSFFFVGIFFIVGSFDECTTAPAMRILACSVTNQDDVEVAKGEALVVAPSEKISVEAPPVPVIEIK